jgi:hypothetical protein
MPVARYWELCSMPIISRDLQLNVARIFALFTSTL